MDLNIESSNTSQIAYLIAVLDSKDFTWNLQKIIMESWTVMFKNEV